MLACGGARPVRRRVGEQREHGEADDDERHPAGPAGGPSGPHPGAADGRGGSGGRHWSSGPGLICTPSRRDGAPCYGAAAESRADRPDDADACRRQDSSIALPGGSHVAARTARRSAVPSRRDAGAWATSSRSTSAGLVAALVLASIGYGISGDAGRTTPARSRSRWRLVGQFGGWLAGSSWSAAAKGSAVAARATSASSSTLRDWWAGPRRASGSRSRSRDRAAPDRAPRARTSAGRRERLETAHGAQARVLAVCSRA